MKPKTLATKASRGGGPPYRLFGRKPLYRWGDGLDWASRASEQTHPFNLRNGGGLIGRHKSFEARHRLTDARASRNQSAGERDWPRSYIQRLYNSRRSQHSPHRRQATKANARSALQARTARPVGHGQRIDFDTINRAALAAFPAVLKRLLPGGKSVGSEFVALNPRRSDAASGRSRSTATTGVGRIAQRRSDFACRISRQRFAGRSGALAGAHAPHRNGPARPAARPLKRPNAAV